MQEKPVPGMVERYRDVEHIVYASPRAEGTKAEDLLTVCSIDIEKQEIRLVRVGSPITMEMTERTDTVLRYGNEGR